MSVMKIAGKSPSDTAVGVAVTADGEIKTVKVWKNSVTEIYNNTPTNTSGKYCTVLDLADVAAVSLRVDNETDVALDLYFQDDVSTQQHAMKKANGDKITFRIPASTQDDAMRHIMITPDDIPQLAWMAKLRCVFYCRSTPTSGSVKITAVTKG